MKVSRDDAVALLEKLGYRTASSWKKEKMEKIVGDLPGLVDEDTEVEPEALQTLLCELVVAVEAGTEIELVEGGDTELDDAEPRTDEDRDADELKELYDEAEEDGVPEEAVGEQDMADEEPGLGDEEVEREEAAVETDGPLPDVMAPHLPEPESTKEGKPTKRKRGRPKGSKNKEAGTRKVKKPKKTRPQKKSKPKTRGVEGPDVGDPKGIRSIRNRLFCAGAVLREHGLSDGLTDELVEAVDKASGKPNIVASKSQLGYAWHVINGFENG